MSRGDDQGKRSEKTGPIEETGLLAILSTLTRSQVEFVLIGGLAVGRHGYPRATKDVDIVPAPDSENIERLWSALGEIEARPLSIGDFRTDELAAAFSLESLLQGSNWDFGTRHGRLDVMQYREGALETDDDYQRLRAGAIRDTYHFGDVWVVGYDDLIDLKTLAGRDQDLTDIRALREANEDTAP